MRLNEGIIFVAFFIFIMVAAASFMITDSEDDGFDHYRTDVDIAVNEDGSALITETYSFRWSDTNNGEMYRSFTDDMAYALDRSSIACYIDGKTAALVPYEEGRQATYTGADNMALYAYGRNSFSYDWEINAFYKRAESGSHTVIFQYELNGVAVRYSDCVDLYYKVFTTFPEDLKDLTVTVTMPAGSRQSDTRIFGHGDPNGYAEFAGGTANAVFKSPSLDAHTMFEIRVVSKQTDLYSIAPTSGKTFDSILEEEERFFKDMELDVLLTNVQIGLIIAILLVSVMLAVFKAKFLKRNRPNFSQPYTRELPKVKPNITAQLESYYKLRKGSFGNKVTATILNLALQKIIAIEKGSGKDLIFVSLNEQAPMTRFEQSVYNVLFNSVKGAEVKRVTLDQINRGLSGGSADHSRLFSDDKQEFDNKGYIDRELEQRNSVWKRAPMVPFILFFPFVAISIFTEFFDYMLAGFLAASVSMFLLLFTSEKGARPLTVEGEDEHAKTQALKRFYTDMTLMKERRAMELPLWEQHLVYATALGVADKVTKELDLRLMELNTLGPHVQTFTYMYALNNIGGLSRGLSSIGEVSNAAFIRRYSAAGGGNMGSVGRGGGGGGFSGGGGGGFGGGGGGHR